MMTRVVIAAVAFMAVSLTSEVSAKKVVMTPMELQALQSHEYQTTKDQVFASVVSVFQDLGYQISQAEMTTGFVSAESANSNKTNLLEAFGGMSSSGRTRATAFVEQFPSGLTRLRLNFLSTKNSSGMYGRSTSNDKPILDPVTYRVAFEKVEQALFERGALTKGAAVADKPKIELPVTPALAVSAPGTGGTVISPKPTNSGASR